MDILYNGWQNKPLYRYGVSPNKLLDYMLSGKPIVHAVASPNDLVADANCGISVPAEDCQAIAEAIQKLCSLTPAQREEELENVVRNTFESISSIQNWQNVFWKKCLMKTD